MDKMKPFGNARGSGRAKQSSARALLYAVFALLVVIVVGAVALAFVDVPAPSRHIEVVVPNDHPAS